MLFHYVCYIARQADIGCYRRKKTLDLLMQAMVNIYLHTSSLWIVLQELASIACSIIVIFSRSHIHIGYFAWLRFINTGFFDWLFHFRGRTFEGIETRYPYRGLSGWKRRASSLLLYRHRHETWKDHRFLPHPLPDWVRHTRCQTVHRTSVATDPRQSPAWLRIQSFLHCTQCLQGGHKERLSGSFVSTVQTAYVWILSRLNNYFDLRKISASKNNSENKSSVGSVSGLA